jgi:hypothetical protein
VPALRREIPGLIALGATVLSAGCSGNDLARHADEPPRELLVEDFRDPRPGLKPDIVELPPDTYLPPPTLRRFIGVETDGEVEELEVTEESVPEPGGGNEIRQVGPAAVTSSAEVGRAWPVEGLVGQINGRPVFADEFLQPLESRLKEFAAMPDRVQGRMGFLRLVGERFDAFVDNELVISESESQLSEGQRQGLFAWLRSMQETEIAERGGNRAAAEESLREDLGMSIDEFLAQRKDEALAATILQRKVRPRTIVAWRDLEQEYRRRANEFAPPPTVLIGRIRLGSEADAAKVAKVRELAAAGRTMVEIAGEIGIAPEALVWQTYQLPPGVALEPGIETFPLADTVKEKLRGLAIGAPSEPIEQRGFTVWLAILGVDAPEAKSIYDPEVQLFLRSVVSGERAGIERFRYIRSLRSRWVTDDIDEIESRLVQVALDRYWRVD